MAIGALSGAAGQSGAALAAAANPEKRIGAIGIHVMGCGRRRGPLPYAGRSQWTENQRRASTQTASGRKPADSARRWKPAIVCL